MSDLDKLFDDLVGEGEPSMSQVLRGGDAMGRICVHLHGGPFDGVICFPFVGAIELGLKQRSTGLVALYELKGEWGSFVGMRSPSWTEVHDE